MSKIKDLIFVNGRGESINLCEHPYSVQSGDIPDYSWEYESDNNRISNVRRKAGKRNFKVLVRPDPWNSYSDKKEQLKEACDKLFSIIDYDAENDTMGCLFCGEYYLPCKMLASSKSDWENPAPYVYYSLTAVSGTNAWICEETHVFSAYESILEKTEYLDYEYDYSYDYAPAFSGVSTFNVNHIASSDFKMVIYGPAVNPRITINNHIYEVDVVLSSGEYLIIDSKERTIIKTENDGSQVNCINQRYKQSSVFEKIAPGVNTINWNGSFGFDLTLYIERSEPVWI